MRENDFCQTEQPDDYRQWLTECGLKDGAIGVLFRVADNLPIISCDTLRNRAVHLSSQVALDEPAGGLRRRSRFGQEITRNYRMPRKLVIELRW